MLTDKSASWSPVVSWSGQHGRMQFSCGHPLCISELNVALYHGRRPNLKLPNR